MAIINSGAILEHDCVVGDFSHISVWAILCGNTNIGNDCFIGAGTQVMQGVNVGDNEIVCIGSIVLRDVLNGTTVCGW